MRRMGALTLVAGPCTLVSCNAEEAPDEVSGVGDTQLFEGRDRTPHPQTLHIRSG